MRTLIVVALPAELADVVLPHPVAFVGVGKVNAALATARAIAKEQPELVINYGSAGGVHVTPGQLVEIDTVVQRDADCEPLSPRGVMYEDVAHLGSGRAGGLRCGSGDSFVRAVDPWTRENCDVVDMELWGIAKACVLHGVRWSAVKWISDAADDAAADHWQQNVWRGAHAFAEWLERNAV